jgi:hypothetical protein
MARLPIPGSDDGTWGQVLNGFLAISHDSDGTIKANAVDSTALQDNSVSGTKIQDNTVTEAKLSAGSGANGQVLTKNSSLSGGFEWTSAAGSPDATTTTKGIVQLAGDLSGTAASPTVPGLANKVNTSTTISAGTGLTGGGDLTTNRTISANFGTTAGTIMQGNDARVTGAEQTANKGAANGYAPLNSSSKVPTANLDDATTTNKGIVQLAGDLAGTATAPTVPGLASKEPIITAGTTSQYFRGDKTFQTLDKTAVGLANVDNTSDADKPVSTAQQAALDLKADKSISISAGTGLSGGGDLSAARTLTVSYGTSAGTAAQGNDSRITGAEQTANKGVPNGYAPLDNSGKVPNANLAIADATTLSKGIVQLAGDLAGTADAPTVPGLAGKEPTITAGTTSQYFRGDKTFQTLDKTAVGLANVDNTSDANKPVSTAQQTALNLKADKATTISAGTGLTGGGDLSANRTLTVAYGTTAGTAAQGNDSRITGAEQTVNKAAANGYASLDGSTKVPIAQVPTGTTSSTVALGNHTHTLTFSLTSFFKTGTLATTTGTQRLPIDGTYTIVGTRLMVGTAPTGADVMVDVNKNGTTIYSTQANRPTITAGTNAGGPGTTPDVTSLAAGDYLTVDIDQIGSTVAGSDLTVSVVVTKTI